MVRSIWLHGSSMLRSPIGAAAFWFLVSATGCATAPQAPPPSIALLVPAGCCSAGARPTLDRLRAALQRRGGVRDLPAVPALEPAEVAPRVRAALRHAHSSYLRMRMEVARRELERARELVARSFGRGVTPEEIGRIHLYLAAVAIAERNEARAREHATAAARLAPKLQPDPLVFGPPVREALERARTASRPLEVRVASIPEGAEAAWNGESRGRTPLAVKVQPGEHLLRLEHPLYLPWEEAPQIQAPVTIHVGLRPRPPAQIAAELPAHPELCPQAARLLQVRTLVWVSESKDGDLRAQACQEQGGLTSALLPASAAQDGDRVVAALLGTRNPAEAAAPTRVARLRKTWWIWAAAGLGVTLGIVLPAALINRGGDGRGVRLELP